MNLKTHKATAEKLLERQRYFALQVRAELANVRSLRQKVRHVEKAQQIVQHVAEDVQNKAHARISSVVSRCLETVFDKPYEFRITFERKRGRTEAVLEFVRNGHDFDPTTMSGGGVVDVAAYALRLACLNLSRPKKRQALILDEPFKAVHSPVYRKRLRDLIWTLSVEMNIQHIIVTGIPDYEIGKVVRL